MELGPHIMLALIEGSVTAAVLALTAIGLNLLFGVMRVVNIAHGEFFMLGAVFAWFITTLVDGHPALAFLVALIAAPVIVGGLASAVDFTVVKRLNYHPEHTIVALIGILYIIQQLTLMGFGGDARPVQPPFNARIALPWLEWKDSALSVIWPWGLSITSYKLAVIGFTILLVFGLWQLMMRTRIGLVMRATRYDRETAQAFGIPVEKVYSIVFGTGAALAALAGVLVVPIQQAYYLMGFDPLLLSFIVVIVGGLGSLAGTIVAAVIIGLSDGIVSVFLSPVLAKIFATLLVASLLIFRPQGLFGERSR